MNDPRFVGTLSLSIAPNGKDMVLDSTFSFIDSKGLMWTAYKNDVVNGANIPDTLKIIIGGAYQQPYLAAAVIHDVYCNNKTRSWTSTARMFYEAMITNGVNFFKARIMYTAVWTFGPHW